VPAGEEGSAAFRVHFADGNSGARISPWHSIPLFAEAGHVRMVCEIPRGTRAKYEVATSEPGNPIKQDTKKGKLRFYGIDMTWNYGMLPQTWEDPAHASADCGGFVGDNDPVDVVDVGDHDPRTGAVYSVKPVAALAMIDEGELDWKVVGIAASDPRSTLVNDVEDMEAHFPGQLDAIREWFRTYKTHEGKPLNKFELNEAFVGRDYTLDVIHQTHGFWRSLVQKSRMEEASGKVVVGDVPVITSCFEQEVTVAIAASEVSSESEAETVRRVLEAIGRELKTPSSAGQSSLPASLTLGA
jgi:inorganic pyrophosphatase